MTTQATLQALAAEVDNVIRVLETDQYHNTARRLRTLLDNHQAQFKELEAAIDYVITQEFDDVCWLDIYQKLATHIGKTYTPKLLSKTQHLANCSKYHDSLASGCPYVPESILEPVRRWINRQIQCHQEDINVARHHHSGEETINQAQIQTLNDVLLTLDAVAEGKLT